MNFGNESSPPSSLLSLDRIARVLVAHGGAQVVVALSGFLRIPFLVSVLGQERYGILVIIGNLGPLLLVFAGGVRIAGRVTLAEAASKPALYPSRLNSLHSYSYRLCKVQLLVSIPVLVILPAASLLDIGSAVSDIEMKVSLMTAAALCACSTVGATSWGVLEARGDLVRLNLLTIATTIGILLGTIAAAQVTSNLIVYAALTSGASTLPFILAPLLERNWTTPLFAGGDDHAVASAVRLGAAQTLPPLATRAADPFIIGPVLGPGAVSVYGVAQRLALVNTMIPAALAPLVSAHLARRRGSNSSAGLRSVAVTAAVYSALAGLVGLILVAIGPDLSRLLTGGEFGVSRSLYVAFLVLGCAFAAHVAFTYGATGPRAMRLGLKIDSAAMIVNLGLSYVLLKCIGMTGPIYASAATATGAVIVWSIVLIRSPKLLDEVH